jgi:uncharacterized protein (TIGR00251 family)
LPFHAVEGGVILAVRLVPRASRNAIDGIVTGPDGRPALQLRLSAPPVDGAANAALIAYLAEALHLRQSAVTLQAGEKSRLKRLHLAGDSGAIRIALEAWVATASKA